MYFLKYVENKDLKLMEILFVISGSVLTFLLTLNYAVYIEYNGYTASDYEVQLFYVAAAVIMMLPVYIFLYKKKNFAEKTLMTASSKSFGISVVLGLFIFLQLKNDTEKNLSHIVRALHCGESILVKNNIPNIIVWILCALAVWGLFIFIVYTVNIIQAWYLEFASKYSKEEKRYICITLFAGVSLICYFFSRTSGPWNSLDLVYQTDTIFVYDHYYPVFSYGFDFDWDIGNGGIRHPLATMITYPIFILVSIVSNLLFWIPNIQAVLYAVIQLILLIFTAIMLGRMINSKWIYYLFTLSYPFILFTVLVEKYPLAVFLIVLYIYTTVFERSKKVSRYALIAASGMMVTSALLGVLYGSGKTIKKRLLEYNEAIMLFLITLIGTGRIHYIFDFYRLLHQNSVMFYEEPVAQWGLLNKFLGFLNLCASSLLPVAYEGTELNFYWIHLTDRVNYFGLAVLLIVLFACIKYVKVRYVLPFIIWFLFSVIQFVGTGFGTGCEPLFSLYFSWAIVPLLILGVNGIIRSAKVRNVLYCVLLIVMFYKNYIHCQDLLAYLIWKAPL